MRDILAQKVKPMIISESKRAAEAKERSIPFQSARIPAMSCRSGISCYLRGSVGVRNGRKVSGVPPTSPN